MAWQYPASISTPDTALNLGTSDSLFVAEGVSLISTANEAVSLAFGTNRAIVVHGTLEGKNAGILGTSGWDINIIVSDDGRIAGGEGGAIDLNFRQVAIHNAGVIESLGGRAIDLGSFDTSSKVVAEIVNSGTLRGNIGVNINTIAADLTLTNSGRIEAGEVAFVDAVVSTDNIVNTGFIQGDILLGANSDQFDGRKGTIDGDVLGQAGNDRLYTGLGSDSLFGGAGSDTLMGGAGADKLDGGADVDTASYASAGAGVKASLANAAQNTGHAQGDTYASIERLIGSKFADTLAGNEWANQLTGGGGADTLTGGAGADRFVFNVKPAGTASADRITDFVTDTDELRLDDASFAGLALGNLSGGAFWASDAGTAHDGSDRVIYEKDTGWIRFDADGNGAGASVAFAKLSAGLNLGADDFFVY